MRVDASGGVERHAFRATWAQGWYSSDLAMRSLPATAMAMACWTWLVWSNAIMWLNDGAAGFSHVVDANVTTGPALVVLVGQRDGVPVVEGRYRLPGVGSEVLAGDMNGDGATDLVVLVGRSTRR